MRPLQIAPPSTDQTPEGGRQRAEQTDASRSLWTSLGARGLSAEALPWQHRIEDHTDFVLALVRQYENRGRSQEELLTAAHNALIRHLNQHVLRPQEVDRFLAFALREALLKALPAR